MILKICDSFEVLGGMYAKHNCPSLSSVAQKICLRKSFKIYGDQEVLLRCFNSFIFLAWSVAPLFGSLEQIPILNSRNQPYLVTNTYGLNFITIRSI